MSEPSQPSEYKPNYTTWVQRRSTSQIDPTPCYTLDSPVDGYYVITRKSPNSKLWEVWILGQCIEFRASSLKAAKQAAEQHAACAAYDEALEANEKRDEMYRKCAVAMKAVGEKQANDERNSTQRAIDGYTLGLAKFDALSHVVNDVHHGPLFRSIQRLKLVGQLDESGRLTDAGWAALRQNTTAGAR